jgi:hypothetical protein
VYPNERRVACRHPQLAVRCARKREDLLMAAETNLRAIQARVQAGRLKSADQIGVAASKVVNRYKVAKRFEEVRPTRHRTADRVHAHILPRMLASRGVAYA